MTHDANSMLPNVCQPELRLCKLLLGLSSGRSSYIASVSQALHCVTACAVHSLAACTSYWTQPDACSQHQVAASASGCVNVRCRARLRLSLHEARAVCPIIPTACTHLLCLFCLPFLLISKDAHDGCVHGCVRVCVCVCEKLRGLG